jgi:hypothetical protein
VSFFPNKIFLLLHFYKNKNFLLLHFSTATFFFRYIFLPLHFLTLQLSIFFFVKTIFFSAPLSQIRSIARKHNNFDSGYLGFTTLVGVTTDGKEIWASTLLPAKEGLRFFSQPREVAKLLMITADEVVQRWREENQGTAEGCRTATDQDLPIMDYFWKDWKHRQIHSQNVMIVGTYQETFKGKYNPMVKDLTWEDLQLTYKTRSNAPEVGMADLSGVNKKTGMFYGADG